MNFKINCTVFLIMFYPVILFSQQPQKALPEGWQYKELKFPEGKIFVPVPIVPKEDEWLNIMVDEFEGKKKMVTMIINKEGYTVFIMPQVKELKSNYLSDDLIVFVEYTWVKNVIDDFVQFENLNGRKFYYGEKTAKDLSKMHNYTTLILLGTTLYTLDISCTKGENKNREICKLIASNIYSPDEQITSYFNPASVEDRTGKIFREDFNQTKTQFIDFESQVWQIRNGKLNYTGIDSTQYSYCSFPGIFSDFTLSAKLDWSSKYKNASNGFFFREDNNDFYVFFITQVGYYQLYKKKAKKWEPITEELRCCKEFNGIVELKVTCFGNNIKCYINGKKVIDTIDKSFSNGSVGFYADGAGECSFDDFYIGPVEVTKNDDFFKEDFKQNISIFPLYNNLVLNNNQLIFLEGDKDARIFYTLEKDYSEGTIISNLKWISGKEDYGYGITFGNSYNGTYNFLISPQGFYMLSKIKNKFLTIVPWTKTDEINPNEFNQLKVTFANKAIRCYINDELVISVLDEFIKPGKIGFIVPSNTICSCNYFEISPPDKDDLEEIEDYKNESLFENFEGTKCTFEPDENWILKNGKMYFVNGDKSYYYRNGCNGSYRDYTISVKAKWEGGGQDDEFGIYFGKEEDAYYTFTIRQNGTYCISKFTGYIWKELTTPVKSDLVENGINELKVTCINNRIIAYINNIQVVDIKDNLISKGYVGVVTYGGVNASFDDFRIGDPEKF